MSFIQNLSQVLKEHIPEDTVLLTRSRAEGRRLLARCARDGMLVGVRAESLTSLAADICSPLLTAQQGNRIMEDSEAVQCMLEALRSPENVGYFDVDGAKTPGAAAEILANIQELELACAPALVYQQGESKLEGLQRLRGLYADKKGDKRWDRVDLLRHAVECCGHHPAARAHYVVPDSFTPTALEDKLLKALAGDRLRVAEVPSLEDAAHGQRERLKDHSRFVSCRGRKTEADFIFRDMLEKGRKAEDCAVISMSGEYGRLLYERGARWGVPVVLNSGLPMRDSRLYAVLKEISALPESENDNRKLCHILEGLYRRDGKIYELKNHLTALNPGWGEPERYRTLLKDSVAQENEKRKEHQQEEIPAQRLEGWLDLLDGVFRLPRMEQEGLEEQRRFLSEFLSLYSNRMLPGEPAAYAKCLELVRKVTALEQGESLLTRVLKDMEKASYLNGNAAPGSVFCVGLNQGLFTTRKYLYVVGMEYYALQGSARQSPVLLDREREKQSCILKTGPSVAEENRKKLMALVSLALEEGAHLTFTYPDHDTDRMLEVSPAPEFEKLREWAGSPSVDRITLLPQQKYTCIDRMVTESKSLSLVHPKPSQKQGGEGWQLKEELSLKEQLKEYIYSPSSLETALKCPLSFYYQKLLHLHKNDPPKRRDDRWLEKNEMGTLCHAVLERYYVAQVGKPPVPGPLNTQEEECLEKLFHEEFEGMKTKKPTVRHEVMEKDRERGMEMVRRAVQWTKDEGRTVLSAEQKFGDDANGKRVGMKLEMDGKEFLIFGSIDRVDQLSGGDQAVLDYKTGDVKKMKREGDLHIQDFLYSRAVRQLNDRWDPKQAGYLMLEGEAEYIRGHNPDHIMEQRIRALLEWMEDEDRAMTPAPAFSLSSGETDLSPGDEDTRKEAYKSCSKFCAYKDLCPWTEKEVKDDDDD